MKFKDIKVGDTVYVKEMVVYGWNESESFWIPKKVERITKTQFLINGDRRFRKDNGNEVGSSYGSTAMLLGEELGWCGIVKDQSKELISFKKKISLVNHINEQAKSIKLGLNSKLSTERLQEINTLLSTAKELLKKSKAKQTI